MDKKTEVTRTDCRSSVGKAVSIIDTISVLCGLLTTKDLKSKAAMAAIRDLQNDEQAEYIIKKLAISKEEVIMRNSISEIVERYKKDSPENKYRKWLEFQIKYASEKAVKAGQPKGHRQIYSGIRDAYKSALDRLPPTSIKI